MGLDFESSSTHPSKTCSVATFTPKTATVQSILCVKTLLLKRPQGTTLSGRLKTKKTKAVKLTSSKSILILEHLT